MRADRVTSSPVGEYVDKLLESRIATCDAVRMEVLAGAHDEDHLRRICLAGLPVDYERDWWRVV